MKLFRLFLLAAALITYAKLQAQTPAFEWVRKSSNVLITNTTTDASGNLLTTGFFAGFVNFGSGTGTDTFSCNGRTDFFVSKMAPDGHLLWVRHFGGPNYEQTSGLVTDGDGNVYITGLFSETIDFGPGPGVTQLSSFTDNTFLLKLNPAGDLIWVKQISGVYENSPNCLAISSHNELLLAGIFDSTIYFGPIGSADSITATAISMFILKLDTAGNYIWAKQMVSRASSIINTCIADHAGNILTVGRLEAITDLDPGPGVFNLTPSGPTPSAWFIQKLDENGNFLWAHKIDSVDLGINNGSIYADANDNYYLGGGFIGTINLDLTGGVHNVTASTNNHKFIMKMDSNANFIWAQLMADLQSMALDKLGNVYLCGTGIRKYLTDGTPQWIIDSSLGRNITISPSFDIYNTGYFSGTVDFDPGPGIDTLSGSNEVFYLKMSQPALAIPGILHSDNSLFTVYPNPNIGSFTINCSKGDDYVITNQLGQVIKEIDTRVGNQGKVTVEGLPLGTYMITSGSHHTEVVIINR